MGLLNLGKKIDKGLELADQAIVDKDKLNDLKYTLEQARAELILSGKGASITKITICGLVTIVVITLTITFIINPSNLQYVKDYAYTAGTLIGILTGGYVTGTTIQKSKLAKD